MLIGLLLAALILPPHLQAADPPAECGKIYIVQSDDWLSRVADKFYGDSSAYLVIIEATNQQHDLDPSFAYITDPAAIEAGWKLCLPITDEAELILASQPDPASTTASNLSFSEPYTLNDFYHGFTAGPDVQGEWIFSNPEELARPEILPEHQTNFENYGYRTNYHYNQFLSDSYFLTSGIFRAYPPEVLTYQASWDSIRPIYRYPPSVTLPTGVTTNQFGWRGPEIALQKPENTIRIAAIGASTTVNGHTYPYSYPEFLQHWLNLWSEANNYDVTFEVINAGREGISSPDLAAIVRYELIPMDLDYIIYYEGANQFDPRTIVTYPANVVYGQPPPGTVPNLADIESVDKSLLDQLSESSALAERTRALIEQFWITGEEPPKPEQTFVLPDGLDELRPERQHLNNILDLNRILQDLDQIHADATAHDVTLLMSTFNWFAHDGMVLDITRHRGLYAYLNRKYWPITYANIRRGADLQNRVFKAWADYNQVPLIDIAAQTPIHPDLYADAIHSSHLGVRVRAWLYFEAMTPMLKEDIESGRLPRPARFAYEEHPYITDKIVPRPLVTGEP